MATTKQYIIGKESTLFLNALNTLQDFKEDLINALCFQYGEELGDKFYQEELCKIEGIEKAIMGYLQIQFVQAMADLNSPEVLTI